MDIAKYILDMEKNENKNKNLIGYMGHMPGNSITNILIK